MNIKRYFTTLLLCIGLGLNALTAIAQTTDMWNGGLRRPVSGLGTKEDPRLITSAEEFAFLMQNYDTENKETLHKYYKLTCNLDMNWAVWRFSITEVGNRTFRGHFDGDGHKISHLIIPMHASVEEVHAGLFCQLGGDPKFTSVIENLEVDGIRFMFIPNVHGVKPANQFRIGGLVGQMYTNSRIENCVVYNVTIEEDEVEEVLQPGQLIKCGAIVGDIQPKFGMNQKDDKVPGVAIANSYGTMESKLTGVKGKKDALQIATVQGSPRGKLQDIDVTVAEVSSDMNGKVYRADFSSKLPATASLKWTLDGVDLNTNGNTCTIGYDCKTRSLSVAAVDTTGRMIASGGVVVNPVVMNLEIASARAIGKNMTVQAKVTGEGSTSLLSKQLLYEWQDLTDGGKVVGTSLQLTGAEKNHTYLLVAKHMRYPNYALSTLYSTSKPLYVNLHGITTPEQIKQYTIDGKTAYPEGDDTNDGTSPEQALRTLKRAYDLLESQEEGGTVANNIIVIMGDYDRDMWAMYLDDACTIPNPDMLQRAKKPALITGAFGNIRGGELQMTGESVLLDADTRFEQLTLHGRRGKDNMRKVLSLYAQDHNLTMGYGIFIDNYRSADEKLGLQEGVHAPVVDIYGGFLNPTDTDYPDTENTITILSGYWGRIIAGSRYKKNVEESGNVTGSPRHPARTKIVLDVANAYNPYDNPFDIALVAGGQGDGSIYALSDIVIKGSTSIGRVVGGNIGFGRTGYQRVKGKLEQRPADSFFGMSRITMESGSVNEIYGTSLGRDGLMLHPEMGDLLDSCACYYYGKAEINIKGGSVHNAIFGGGVGSVSGLRSYYYTPTTTLDPLIPYMLSNGRLTYGNIDKVIGKLPHILVKGDSLIRIEKTDIVINISDKAHIYSSVYGGGHGYSNQLKASYATSQAGNVFGTTTINMTGGIVEGNIYGGGKGSLTYFDTHGLSHNDRRDISAEHFADLAQVHGIATVNITGGKVMGTVFGAGEGSLYRPVSKDDDRNIADKMAAVYGNTRVHIGGTAEMMDCVFGGGYYCNVVDTKPDDKVSATYVLVDGGKLHNSVFAGGHGHEDEQNSKHSVLSTIFGETCIDVRGGEFVNDTTEARFGKRHFGIFGGGNQASVVHGTTWVNVYRGLMNKEFFESTGNKTWSTGRSWDLNYAVCGGGFGHVTDVYGDTHVTIDLSDVPTPDKNTMIGKQSVDSILAYESVPYQQFMDVFGGGLMGNVGGNTSVTIKGNPIIRSVYGGSLLGMCGMNEKQDDPDLVYHHSKQTNEFKTGTYVDLYGGRIWRAYGGSLMGDVCGETHLTIGSREAQNNNQNLYVFTAFGGNDACGTIAGSNNELYGTNVNVYGGNIMNALYGGGDGEVSEYAFTLQASEDIPYMPAWRVRPHVASVKMNIMGNSAEDCARIYNNVFAGGNNATVCLVDRDAHDKQEWGMVRELVKPNSGKVMINIGNHVRIRSLRLGCNGSTLMASKPRYTTDGKTWKTGFIDETDFQHFLRHVDMPSVPQLTFNADGGFQNKYHIDDQTGRVVEINTPGEMDATDIEIESFFVGGNKGSMTADGCYAYTLPTGVKIMNQIVGGSQNSNYKYTNPETKVTYKHIGGIYPYSREVIRTDRVQLNVFCQFDDMVAVKDNKGNPSHKGAKIFAGCLDRGIIMGNVSLNMHGNMMGKYKPAKGETFATIASEWNTEGGIIYGAGKGEETEIHGDTYVNIIGARLNGKPCIPNLLNAFAGGMKGRVVGKTNMFVDIQLKGVGPQLANQNAIWGSVYGGGRMGDVVQKSQLTDYVCKKQVSTYVRVNSGMVNYVFGGARMANVEGPTMVNIEDQSHGHFHTIVGHVYGGNDLSGTIKRTTFKPAYSNDSITANCHVRVYENPHEDGTYSGFPLVVELYGGGNGNYGNADKNGVYTDGAVMTRNGDSLQLKGMKHPDVESTVIDISGGTLYNVYGGANNANVTRDATINVNFVDPEVRAQFNRLSSELCYARGRDNVFMDLIHAGIDDDGIIMSPKWNIFRLFGGNNQMTYKLNTKFNLTNGRIGNIYGGCNRGNVDTDIVLSLDAPELYVERVFGGSRMGNVINGHNTKIEILNGQYGAVFGGNDITGDISGGTHMIVRGGEVREVYGAGNGHYLYSYSTDVDRVTEVWSEELNNYIYYVPATDKDGGPNADFLQKTTLINTFRPNCHKTYVEIGGTDSDHLARVTDAVYAGGRCATILDYQGQSGDISIDLGDYSEVGAMYMGANGEPHVDNKYIAEMMYVNHITKLSPSEEHNFKVLEKHMEGVLTHGLPNSFKFRRQYEHCTVGSFFFGGRRGSLTGHGELNVSFPQSLVITDKIVGGSDRADIRVNVGNIIENDMLYQGGILWDGMGSRPVINMDVKCKLEGDAKVYGGCFQSGKIDGSVNLQMEDETEELF